MTPKEMAKLAYETLQEKMAEDIEIIDISGISTLADYFIIATGKNSRHVQTLVDEVDNALGRAGAPDHHDEGYRAANWVLMDYNDIVIHVFSQEDRRFYDLERIWRNGQIVDPKDLEA